MKDHTVVIARYAENLEWISKIPEEMQVVVYNKGEAITDVQIISRINKLESRANFGREAETFLHHIGETQSTPQSDPEAFTIFCQGDPFGHSPDFLSLLEKVDSWDDLQPLSWQWIAEKEIPPPHLLASETAGFIDEFRVRTELFSLHNWNALKFHDSGATWIAASYLGANNLPNGANIAEHFFKSVGWAGKAGEASTSVVGEFCYAAIFAVKNRLLCQVPNEALVKMIQLSRHHMLYAYILERLWLHIFGRPFTKLSMTPRNAPSLRSDSPRGVAANSSSEPRVEETTSII